MNLACGVFIARLMMPDVCFEDDSLTSVICHQMSCGQIQIRAVYLMNTIANNLMRTELDRAAVRLICLYSTHLHLDPSDVVSIRQLHGDELV